MEDLSKIILSSQISRIDGARKSPLVETPKPTGPSFENVLDSEIKLSKHAEKRIQSRQLEIREAHRSGLNEAFNALSAKGAKDSLVVMNELAFVVNVPSRTVVTAIGTDQMKEQVFTNIDSTIFVNT